MKKIYLFCDSGMSTSLLVTKMKEVAAKHNLDLEIAAYPYGKAHAIITKQNPDCVLLGPQVRFLFKSMQEKYHPLGIPVEVIDAADYGVMNGENVLKQAIAIIKSNQNNK